MKQKIWTQWIAALRSGEFKQTAHALKDDNGYCCLGVLTELHRRAVPGFEWHTEEGHDDCAYGRPTQDYDVCESGGLSAAVRRWAGVQSEDPVLLMHVNGKRAGTQNAAYLNDNGYSFDYIATSLEMAGAKGVK